MFIERRLFMSEAVEKRFLPGERAALARCSNDAGQAVRRNPLSDTDRVHDVLPAAAMDFTLRSSGSVPES